MSTVYSRANDGNALRVLYLALGNETGDAFSDADRFPDKTVLAYGTGTVTVEGSNDGANFVALKDQSGTAISLVLSASTAAAFILENTRYLRAKNTSSTGARIEFCCCK